MAKGTPFVAEEVFFQHKFIEKLGVWKRLEIDGSVGRIDQTFNHQLWFASCASLLLRSDSRKKDECRYKN